MQSRFYWLAIPFLVLPGMSGSLLAADWPMWRYDANRSAASPEPLPAKLNLQWVREYTPLKPAWPDQAKMQFDVVREPVVQGTTLYMNSSQADAVRALDTRTGEEKWIYFTDGPVRFAPVACQGNVYFTSDDGYLYCVNGETGTLNWKHRGGPSDRKILGNERLISTWPARGAPVIADGKVYFAASIWPFMGIFIHALDAKTGQPEWTNDGDGSLYMKQPHNTDAFASIAPQGPMVVLGDKLLVPGGRSVPAYFDRKSGALLRYQLADNGKN
jgi:outer membrane protein assembly factor BamB